jgi:hypothetical protein
MSQVCVYILSADPNSIRTSQAKSLFSNGLFIVNIVTMNTPDNLVTAPTQSHDDAVEAYRVSWCLNHARNNYSSNHVIVVKDTSVSNVDPNAIADIVSAVMSSKDWHLCYLCRWLDRCDLYTDKRPINGMTTLIAKTQSPHGVQAIMFSPEGRDVVLGHKQMKNQQSFVPISRPLGVQLNEAVASGWLDATCIVPNLIEYDITAARSAHDYKKLNECEVQVLPVQAGPTGSGLPGPAPVGATGATGAVGAPGNVQLQQTNGLSGWWFVLIVLIVLIILAAVVWGPKYKRHMF